MPLQATVQQPSPAAAPRASQSISRSQRVRRACIDGTDDCHQSAVKFSRFTVQETASLVSLRAGCVYMHLLLAPASRRSGHGSRTLRQHSLAPFRKEVAEVTDKPLS
jgi:hypothetical protein